MYISRPPPRPVTAPPAPGGDGKTTLAPPGGCGRGGGGGRQRLAVKERIAEERARTLFRLRQTVASLSFSGTRRSLSPLTSSSSRTAAASFPLPLFLFPPRLPRRPSPPPARVLRAPPDRRKAQVSSILSEPWKSESSRTCLAEQQDGRMWHLKQLHPPCDQTGVHPLGMTSARITELKRFLVGFAVIIII
ncbi:uncharacterized protein LOC117999042 isoform X2 [Mirounga leonina]|uniref:uncharacterized protein LOC117999042 isoform X2 n=1 Tax=Mirounga leonina TaxID=9715 RepID=UPI00156C1A9E|nr:uncharacterized protein LOC117999042 isoform X2 [Mirounga leonina]